jgi:hypothetical protein
MKHTKWFASALMVTAICASSFAQDLKKVYIGVRLGGGVGLNTLKDERMKALLEYNDDIKFSGGGGSFDVAIPVSFQLTNIFALQSGHLLTRYSYAGSKYKNGDYSYSYRPALVLPALVQFTLFERKLSFFAVPHASASFGSYKFSFKKNGNKGSIKLKNLDNEETTTYMSELLFGLTFGASTGLNIGPGNLFFDIRYLTDLGNVKEYSRYCDDDRNNYVDDEIDIVHRAKLIFSVGYEFGMGKR